MLCVIPFPKKYTIPGEFVTHTKPQKTRPDAPETDASPPIRDEHASCRWALHAQPGIHGFATWELDLTTGICRYSPEWVSITGYTDHLLGEPQNWSWWSGRMHVDDMATVRKAQHIFFTERRNEIELIFRLRRADGRWIRLLSRGTVTLWTEDGKPALMSGIVIDLSHLSNADLSRTSPEAGTRAPENDGRGEAEPEETGVGEAGHRAWINERRLNALHQLSQMENASENELAHFTLASIMQLTGSGSSFLFLPDTDLFGSGRMFWSRDHYFALGREYLPEEYMPREFHPHMANESGAPISRLLRNGDGVTPLFFMFDEKLPIMRHILCPVVEDGRVVCLAGICNKDSDYDESDMRQLETFIKSTWLILRRHRSLQELRRAKDAAEAVNRAKNEFLANISHELRTPLNGILSMLQLLEDLPMPPQQRDLVSTANYSGKALVRIIADILDFSRMESGKMQLVPEPFDLKASLLSSLRLFKEEAARKGLAFGIAVDPDIPAVLTGDDARVRQILFNLVGNALKFTEHGDISVRCALEERFRDGGVRVSIRVTDTGIGIPPEKQGMIFDAFTQVDSSSTRKYPGTGLGLSIVKCLAALMGGTVELESEEGKGTTIVCTLVLAAASGQLPESPEAGESPEKIRPLSILVAEDDAVGRFAIRSFLQRAGHRVVCVDNGRQALEALQLYPFDCLFTDIQMPDMDGMELARRIRTSSLDGITPTEAVLALVREVFPQASESALPIDPQCVIVAVSAHTMAGDKDRFLRQGIDHYVAKPIAVRELSETLRRIAAGPSAIP